MSFYIYENTPTRTDGKLRRFVVEPLRRPFLSFRLLPNCAGSRGSGSRTQIWFLAYAAMGLRGFLGPLRSRTLDDACQFGSLQKVTMLSIQISYLRT